MWRNIVLVLAAAAGLAMLACGGGGGDEQPEACNFRTAVLGQPRASASQRIAFDEAPELVGYELVLPEFRPNIAVEGPRIVRSQHCPENVFDVELVLRGPDFTIVLSERPADAPPPGGLREPFRINGVEGVIQHSLDGDGIERVGVSWSDGERRYDARAMLAGSLTDELFLQILESIPE